MKTILKTGLVLLASVSLIACGNKGSDPSASLGDIMVVSREDGSGTRGAFTELTGVLQKFGDTEVDQTTKAATIQNNTEGVVSTVSGNPSAIGYMSLGSLTDAVKPLNIDGIEPSEKTVLDGTYPIQRPFNIVFKEDISETARDFMAFIHSSQGQAVVADKNYIPVKLDATDYSATKASGTISIVGSTSVTPLMEKLAEAYRELNPDVKIDITSNGSSAGVTAVQEGVADIGMVSRELKDKEKPGITVEVIALDGIAVIINKENALANLTLDQVKGIYTGELLAWDDLAN
ncbi:phosphate transport system substrate-binding protein [Streptococcus rupicaprae]|uniref:Phosphate transport system substrate-binding protein n=1 Tax=Streptococcus rupicaprae TaxID=759619 RepID=A0ABV2FHP5_9STRE